MKKISLVPIKGTTTGMVRTIIKLKLPKLVIGLAMVPLAACSSITDIGKREYGCPGIPSGVKCMSARDVYTLTNDGNVPLPMSGETEVQDVTSAKGASGYGSGKGGRSGNGVQQGGSDAGYNQVRSRVADNYVAPRLPDQPVPIRTPAEVMRIWVAPWEDTNGDLIVTGYIYTEIEPRRWVIGEQAATLQPTIRPLRSVEGSVAGSDK